MLSSSLNRNLVDDSRHPTSVGTFIATIEQLIPDFVQVSWPNIGQAAAGPAGPAPTALRLATLWWYVAGQSVESCHAGLELQRVAVVLQVVMSYCQTEQDNRFEGIFAVNTHESSSVVKSNVEIVERASNTLTSCKIYCPWAYFHMTMIIFISPQVS